MQSALAGLDAASKSFERAAVEVTRQGALASNTDSAASVTISAQARSGNPPTSDASVGGLADAMVDTRIAKYAFIANLRVLQAGDEMAAQLTHLGKKA